ncbi:hypothetical protein K438DRAFT_1815590 [Mycena galopus ATCC 62051]|nr:hypothetical protein K438DRAFT_1815590 [Mycena galopus ATCC 62051]
MCPGWKVQCIAVAGVALLLQLAHTASGGAGRRDWGISFPSWLWRSSCAIARSRVGFAASFARRARSSGSDNMVIAKVHAYPESSPIKSVKLDSDAGGEDALVEGVADESKANQDVQLELEWQDIIGLESDRKRFIYDRTLSQQL